MAGIIIGRHADARRRNGRVCRTSRSRLVSAVVALFMLAHVVPSAALVSTPITIDGAFEDWAAVFEDATNCVYDPTGDAGNTNMDLTVVAATMDGSYLYHYIRRATSTGGAAPTYLVFLDLDGDHWLESGDLVLRYSLTGGNAYSGASLYRYVPADPAGDPLPGDGARPPGSWSTQIALPAGSVTGAGEAGGTQFEARIALGAIGVAPDTPIAMQFGSTLGGARDDTSPLALRRYGVSLTPASRSSGASADTTVTYVHTVRNTGNTPATYGISINSTSDWQVTVSRAQGASEVTSVTLAPGEAADLIVAVHVPAGTPDGVRDTATLRVMDLARPAVTATANDTTLVGPVIVIPDQSGSMAPGGTITFRNTVINNSEETRTVLLSATSTKAWPTEIRDASLASTLTAVTLAPHDSAAIAVVVSVPAEAAYGTRNITTIRGVIADRPDLAGTGTDTTIVQPALSVEPDNQAPAGPGSAVSYRHVVTNSWSETRTVTLGVSSSGGWTVRIFASDGSTPVSSLTLAPYGGAAEVIVRVSVPAGTPAGLVDTSTVTATIGSLQASATDRTTVSTLVTYGVGGFGTPQDTFVLGDRVFVRAMGLNPGSQVRFRFTDPNGASTTSGLGNVDGGGVAQAAYDIAPTATTGTWAVTLLDGAGTPITTTPFHVGYKASMSALSVSGGQTQDSTVTIGATLLNEGAVDLTGTQVTYLVWWDTDGDGSFESGDEYVSETGTLEAYGTGSGVSRRAGALSVAPGAQYTDTWAFSNRILVEEGTYHLEATWTAADGRALATRSTTFHAVPGGPWIALTVSEQDVDFGAIDPSIPYVFSDLGIAVKANVDFDLLRYVSGDAPALGLTTALDDLVNQTRGDHTFSDRITVEAPWDTDPGTYQARIVYTVVPR